MTSDEHVYFDFLRPIDLPAIEHDYVRPLRNLIELAAAERTRVLTLTVTPEDGEPFDYATVLTEAPRRDVPEPQYPFRFLFTLSDIDLDEVLPRWWRVNAEIGVVCDLVASLRERGFVSDKFLKAASAMEGYHQHRYGAGSQSPEHKARIKRILDSVPGEDRAWLADKLGWSHQPTFAERLKDVLARVETVFPAELRRSRGWSRWVKDARNSVAHRAPTMVNVDREWRTTVDVTTTIQWLMIIVLLRDLGVPDDAIKKGVEQDGHLKHAIRQLREVHSEWFAGTR